MNKADKEELEAGDRWTALAEKLGVTLWGWTGDHSATFRTDDHFTFRLPGAVLRHLGKTLAQ